MKNTFAICEVARQLAETGKRIESLSMGAEQLEQNGSGLTGSMNDLRLDELEHAQMLTLKLTELISQELPDTEARGDGDGGSVFAEGDLTVEKTGEASEVETTKPTEE